MRNIVKKYLPFLLATVICLCALCVGCSFNKPDDGGESDVTDKDDKTVFTVMITENPDMFEVVSENPVYVAVGGTAEFSLKTKDDYCVDRVFRQGQTISADIVNEYDGTTTVSLENIGYSLSVGIECVLAAARLAYYPNGGVYVGRSGPNEPYVVGHALKSRLRPNSEIGTDRLRRDGHLLTGWNTAADGSGEHIGLGSRVTVPRGKTRKLYAQWEKTSPAENFKYRKYGDSVTVTKYIGTQKKVVVPDRIDGAAVDWIAYGAFSGDVETVILPPSVIAVENGAFTDCGIRELYFYDNIGVISDSCFVNCPDFATIHINAVLAPRYGAKNLHSEINLADKYDILILNEHRKKLLVFGGSGAYISVDTMQIERGLKEKTNEDYVCINMAVNGWFNGAAQFDMMLPYIKEGDIFIHAPESASQFGFMYETSMTPSYDGFDYNKLRFYYCLESNYDLFSLIDRRHVESLLDGFAEFNALRKDMAESTYNDYATQINLYGTVYKNDMGWIDLRGNFILPKTPRGEYLDAGEADIVPEYIKDETARGRLNGYYDKIKAKGGKVYFLTAPINRDTLLLRLNAPESLPPGSDFLYSARPYDIPLLHDDLGEWVADFDNTVRTYLSCTVLLPLARTIYTTKDFFDSDYHLSDSVVPVYTGAILDALCADLRSDAK